MYKPLYLKLISNKDLPYSKGNFILYLVISYNRMQSAKIKQANKKPKLIKPTNHYTVQLKLTPCFKSLILPKRKEKFPI